MKPIIYQTEIDDGLEQYFGANLSITYNIPVILATNKNYVGKVKNVSGVVGKLIEDDFLYEYPAILVTAGVWNKNDQVFDKFEVWKAKYTPLNKPANLDHKPDKVVGHTNRVFAITDEETPALIPSEIDGKPNMDIPDIFHLLTVDSFYKYNIKAYQKLNEEYSASIQKIYDKIIDGELCVSMECIFSDFDYAVMKADGKQEIIKRDAKSSFLTKKLRAFKGSGEYQGAKIGMLMRDIVFTGKGITDDPANPASVIFSKDSLAFASQNYVKSEDIFETEINSAYIPIVNGEEIMKLEEAQAKITELEGQLVEAKKIADELAKTKTEVETAKTESDKVKAELASANESIKKVTDEKVALEQKLAESNKSLAEANTKVASTEKDLSVAKAEKLKLERVGLIKENLGMDNTDAEKNYIVVAALTDENFKAWLDNTKAFAASKDKTTEAQKAELAKAAKDVEDQNKAEAAKKLEDAKKSEKTLVVANVEVENKNKTKLNAVKSVFAKVKNTETN